MGGHWRVLDMAALRTDACCENICLTEVSRMVQKRENLRQANHQQAAVEIQLINREAEAHRVGSGNGRRKPSNSISISVAYIT